jgi:UDP-glucose 4-epimerase
MPVKVLITGGAGFIGGHSARALLERGHSVFVLDDLSAGKRENVPRGAELHVLDIRSPEAVRLVEALKPDAVLHLAAQTDVRRSMSDAGLDASINVLGTVNLLQACVSAGTKRFCFASSGGAIYGEQDEFPAREDHPRRPASAYGASKLCAEEYLAFYGRAFGLSGLALRYANVYGPGQSPDGEAGVVAIFLQKMLSGGAPIINGDGLQTRDFVYVGDVARINALAVESSFTGALNVGTGRETDLIALSAMLARAANYEARIAHASAKPGEQRRSAIDPSRAFEVLGWRPQVALEQGIAETAAWFAIQLEVSPASSQR